MLQISLQNLFCWNLFEKEEELLWGDFFHWKIYSSHGENKRTYEEGLLKTSEGYMKYPHSKPSFGIWWY